MFEKRKFKNYLKTLTSEQLAEIKDVLSEKLYCRSAADYKSDHAICAEALKHGDAAGLSIEDQIEAIREEIRKPLYKREGAVNQQHHDEQGNRDMRSEDRQPRQIPDQP